jgi:hypothetical protein
MTGAAGLAAMSSDASKRLKFLPRPGPENIKKSFATKAKSALFSSIGSTGTGVF